MLKMKKSLKFEELKKMFDEAIKPPLIWYSKSKREQKFKNSKFEWLYKFIEDRKKEDYAVTYPYDD